MNKLVASLVVTCQLFSLAAFAYPYEDQTTSDDGYASGYTKYGPFDEEESPDRFKNKDILAPWNDPLKQNDILAPWNDPIKKGDTFAPWNSPLDGPRETNRYMQELGEKDSEYYWDE